jgi:hypothetical protein
MRRAFMSLAVLASLSGIVGQVKADGGPDGIDNGQDITNTQVGDQTNDPSVTVTPDITPAAGPAASVPLPAGAWAGLIGIAACGLVTVTRRKVAVA